MVEMGRHGLCAVGHIADQFEPLPLNILVHGTGSLGWTLAGIITNDRALTVNFGMQMPLFALGYAKMGGLF